MTYLQIGNKQFPLNEQVSTVEVDIYSDKANTSYDFKVPATAELRQTLNFLEEFNSETPTNKIGEIKNGNEVIISGLVIIKGVEIEGNANYYNLLIVGDNYVWFKLLENKPMRHLDLWSYTHAWTAANQTEIPGEEYFYPLIDNSELGKYHVYAAESAGGTKTSLLIKGPIYGSDFNGFSIKCVGFKSDEYNITVKHGDYHVYDNGVDSRIELQHVPFQPYDVTPETGYVILKTTNPRRIRVTDRYPAISESFLIKKIFEGVGYKVVSNYVDMVLSKTYTVYEGNQGWAGQNRFSKHPEFRVGIIEDISYPAQPTGSQDYIFEWNNIVFDNGNFFDLNNFWYKTRIYSRQDFDFALTFEVIGSVTLSFWVMSDTNFYRSITLQTYTTGTHTIKTSLSAFANIPENEQIYFKIRVENSTNSVTFQKGNCFWWNECRFLPRKEGDNRYLIEHLPQVTQLSYVKAIIKRDGLEVFADLNTQTIYIENIGNLIDNTAVVDWRALTDSNKSIGLEILESPNVKYLYNEDNDDTTLKFLKETFEIDYGSNTIGNGSETLQSDLFAATAEDVPTIIGFTETKIPKIVLENLDDQHVCRVLRYEGATVLSSESWLFGTTTRTTAPIPYFVEGNYPLSYSDTPTKRGLYYRNFYQKHLENKIVTIYLNLQPSDINNFFCINDSRKADYRGRYYIRTPYGEYPCAIEKIEQYVQGETTKCTFRILSDDAYIYPIYEEDTEGGSEIG